MERFVIFMKVQKDFLCTTQCCQYCFNIYLLGYQGVLAPWDEEDGEDLTRAAIIGNLNAVFLLGDMLTEFADYVQDKPWAGDFVSIPLIDQSREIGSKVRQYLKTVAG